MNRAANTLSRKPAFLGLPRTRAGWWSIGLAFGFVVLFAAWFAYIKGIRKDRPTFFSDPVHVILLLSSVASAVSGLVVGVVAVARRRERSLAILPGLLLGLLVLFWAFVELTGHD